MAAQKRTARQCRGLTNDDAVPSAINTTHEPPAIALDGPAAEKKFRLVKAQKSREREVEKAKSMIYGALPQIIGGVIKEAVAGNHNAARFLMQYAGIQGFALPSAAEDKSAKENESAAEPELVSPEERVEHFYKVLGMKPPSLMPPEFKPERDERSDEWWMLGRDAPTAAEESTRGSIDGTVAGLGDIQQSSPNQLLTRA